LDSVIHLVIELFNLFFILEMEFFCHLGHEITETLSIVVENTNITRSLVSNMHLLIKKKLKIKLKFYWNFVKNWYIMALFNHFFHCATHANNIIVGMRGKYQNVLFLESHGFQGDFLSERVEDVVIKLFNAFLSYQWIQIVILIIIFG